MERHSLLGKRIAQRHRKVSCIILNEDFQIVYLTSALSSFGFDTECVPRRVLSYTEFVHEHDRADFIAAIKQKLRGNGQRTFINYRQFNPETQLYADVFGMVYQGVNPYDKSVVYNLFVLNGESPTFYEDYANACEMEMDLRYKYTMDTIPVPLVMTQEYKISFANEAFSKMLGYELEQLHGMDVGRIAAQEDHTTMRERIQRRYCGEQFMRYTFTGVRSDNTRIDVDVAGTAIHTDDIPTSMAVLMDATEQNRNKSYLNMLHHVMDEMNDGAMLADLDFKITWLNKAAAEQLGKAFNQTIGLGLSAIYSVLNVNDIYERIKESVLTTGEWRGMLWHEGKAEKANPYEVSVTTLRHSDESAYRYIVIFRDITDRIEKERLASERAEFDRLTGLHNRSYFLRALSERMQVCNMCDIPMHLLLIDLDRFSVINNLDGYETGDEVLRLLAMRLRGFVGDDSRLARLGEDNFVIMLEDGDPVAYANMIAQLFDFPVYVEDKQYRLTATMGIAAYPKDADTADKLITCATIAVEQTRNTWKTSIKLYDQSMRRSKNSFNPLETDLRNAIDKQNFQFFYQPKVDIQTNKVVACEALIRWFHESKGIISPGEFIPLAEETGLIVPLGDIALEMSCRQIRRWMDKGLEPIPISVNLSHNQLLENNFISKLSDIITYYNVPPGLLEIEVTEYVAMHNNGMVRDFFKKMGEMGISVSIDDFGTGYSSLGQLTKFHVDVIKIDRSFIIELSESENSRAIVQAIILMSHSLGMKTVAEGVETKEQLEALRALGCDEMQGYLFSKPIPPDDFERFLARKKLPQAGA